MVAKGAGVIAARIREEAEEHRVPDGRRRPAGPDAVRRCEVGQEIPVDLYDAVAQVLAFVMALRPRARVAGVHTAGPALPAEATRAGRAGRRPVAQSSGRGAAPADGTDARTAPHRPRTVDPSTEVP